MNAGYRSRIADRNFKVGNPKRVPQPSREELRRAEPGYAHAIKWGTLRGFPSPPAKSSAGQSPATLTRSSGVRFLVMRKNISTESAPKAIGPYAQAVVASAGT